MTHSWPGPSSLALVQTTTIVGRGGDLERNGRGLEPSPGPSPEPAPGSSPPAALRVAAGAPQCCHAVLQPRGRDRSPNAGVLSGPLSPISQAAVARWPEHPGLSEAHSTTSQPRATCPHHCLSSPTHRCLPTSPIPTIFPLTTSLKTLLEPAAQEAARLP